MKKNTVDRRVTRTHTALREALIELILERGWEEISVQDICDRANIGRSTFYGHFTCKEELLTSAFGDLRKALRAEQNNSDNLRKSVFGFVQGLIEHAHENQRLFRAVIGKRSGLVIQRRFRQLLIELVDEDLTFGRIPVARRAAGGHYIAGALFELLTWWIDSRSQLSPHELEVIFRELTMPVFSALHGTGQD